jgi:hypothetical protein
VEKNLVGECVQLGRQSVGQRLLLGELRSSHHRRATVVSSQRGGWIIQMSQWKNVSSMDDCVDSRPGESERIPRAWASEAQAVMLDGGDGETRLRRGALAWKEVMAGSCRGHRPEWNRGERQWVGKDDHVRGRDEGSD